MTGFWRLSVAEWTKFRTVRSSYWTLVIAVALTVGIGAAFLPVMIDTYDGPASQAAGFAVSEGWWFEGLHVGILAVMILGALAVTAEYGSGTIRATLSAVPSRWRVVLAKVAGSAVVVLVAGAAQALAAFVVARPILADQEIDVALTDADALRGVAMATLAMVGAGLLGLGAGLLVRHTPGAIGAVIAAMMVVPILAQLLPDSWDGLVKVLPSFAMNAMFTPNDDTLSPGPAAAVFFGYVAVLLVIGGITFTRRDT